MLGFSIFLAIFLLAWFAALVSVHWTLRLTTGIASPAISKRLALASALTTPLAIPGFFVGEWVREHLLHEKSVGLCEVLFCVGFVVIASSVLTLYLKQDKR